MIKRLQNATQLLWMSACLLAATSGNSYGQVSLSGTSYTQNFDAISTELPAGWTVRTGATATLLGASASFNTTPTAWNNSTGAFKNFASADGLASDATTTIQNAAADRALGLRQTGTVGDPGAAFVLQLANTSGLTNFKLSFKLQSLDIISPRTTTWRVDYGIGDNPASFSALTATGSLLTGNASFTNNQIDVDFGSALNNLSEKVWIRIVTVTGSSGSGNRATTGIDDVLLSYENTQAPLSLSVNNVSVTEGNAGETDATFTVSLNKPAPEGGVSFDIATADGSATAGNDYTARNLPAQVIPQGNQTYSFTVPITGDTEPEPDEIFYVNLSNVIGAVVADGQGIGTIINDDAALITRIYEIQGNGASSPKVNTEITTTGVVTGDFQGAARLNGFYIQDIAGDGNPATSDGIFVFLPTTNPAYKDVQVGDAVEVSGRVTESFGLTQLDNITVLTITGSAQQLPAATTINLPGNLEPYEGMLVRFPQKLTVTENYNLGLYGELDLSLNGKQVNPTNFIDPNDNPASGLSYTGTSNLAAVTAQQTANDNQRILLDDGSNSEAPNPAPYINRDATQTLRRGTYVEDLAGILSYGFSRYRVQPTGQVPFVYAPRPQVPEVNGSKIANLKVAGMNVLNYFNGDGSGGGFPTSRGAESTTEFTRQRIKIFEAIKALNADAIGLMEVENDGDGTSSAIADLVNGLNAYIGSPLYQYIADPATGVGTDLIKVAIIYKPSVLTPVGVSLSKVDAIFERLPVAQTFSLNANGEKFTLVVNHFKSKGSCPSSGDTDKGQGCWNVRRIGQAEALLAFIDQLKTTDEDVLAVGDFNAYEQEDPIDRLRVGGLISLVENSYSYTFEGQEGSLDHALATQSLYTKYTGGGKWHINADEPRLIDYDLNYYVSSGANRRSVPKGDDQVNLYTVSPFRSADHDPVLVGFRLNTAPVLKPISDKTIIAENTLNLTLSASDADGDALTYSISSGLQEGMILDAQTGAFSWKPTDAQIGTFEVTFRVTDNGSPALSNEQSVTITVKKRTAVNFAASGVSLNENTGTYTLALVFETPLEEANNFKLTFTDGNGLVYGTDYIVTGYQTKPEPLLISVPAGSSLVTVPLEIKDDKLDELDETLTVSLIEAGPQLKISEPSSFALTILDNDVPAVSLQQSAITRSEGSGAFTVPLKASIAPVSDLAVKINLVEGINTTYGPGRDYVTLPDGLSRSLTVIIPAGQTSAFFTVTPLPDNVKEKDPETVSFVLAAPANSAYTLGETKTFVFTITDSKKASASTGNTVAVWPNPTTGSVTIAEELSTENLEVTLRSPEGAILYHGKGKAADLSQQVSTALHGQRKGIYHLQLITDEAVQHTRIFKY